MLLGRRTPHRKDSFRLVNEAFDETEFLSFMNLVKHESINIKRIIKGELAYDVFSRKFLSNLFKYGVLMRVTSGRIVITVPTCLTHMILDGLIGYEHLKEII